MDDDVNFCGGRLRLAAFLRVVEKGIPERPARFKRRVPWVDQTASRAEDDVPAFDHVLPAASLSQTNERTESISRDLSEEHITDSSNHVREVVCLEVGVDPHPNSAKHPDFEYDVPRSPTPTNISLPHGDYPHMGSTEESCNESDCANTRTAASTIPSNLNVTKLQTTKVQRGSGKSQKPSSARKRRLRVRSLALLRTSTTDGLPSPSDADNVFVTPITKADPIEDSQMRAPLGARLCPQGVTLLRASRPMKEASAHINLPLSENSAKGGMSLKDPLSILGPDSATKRSLIRRALRSHIVADGFEADELVIASTKKAHRRRKLPPRELKQTQAVSGLALATGALPTPLISHHSMSSPSELVNSRSTASFSGTLPTASHPRPSIDISQATLPRSRHSSNVRPHSRDQSSNRESAIRGQLLSITAPIRRESDSSESDGTNEVRSMDSEGDDNDDVVEPEEDFSFDSVPALSGRRHSYVEDSRYFENAIHNLDIEEQYRSPEDEVWSQYNDMV
ncbi:hypothetical protein EK21DRAFT_86912 [Setomelanomma holmii]|uniref:Uncharacterized protein n=1 Tax=Setomelanomma holmii TaxID=210430 RepID=A0A9P4HDL3_9PLEO|nr:hypothetical protein EK21DRAFT_86912 [Setomelanomma holmii]